MKNRKKSYRLVVVAVIVVVAVFQIKGLAELSSKEKIKNFVISELQQAIAALESNNQGVEFYKMNYINSRKHYKRISFFIESVSPREAKYFINGPAIPKHDSENGSRVVNAKGYQVLEAMIYGNEKVSLTEFNNCRQELIKSLATVLNYYQSLTFSEAKICDFIQLELYRISSLNLAGYDAAVLKNNSEEASWSILGMQHVVSLLPRKTNDIQRKISISLAFLQRHESFESFPRLQFITECIQPLNRAIIKYRTENNLEFTDQKTALLLNSSVLFAKETLNLRFFSMYYNDTLTVDAQASLGKLLFFDPILSGNNQRSCASCHNPSLGFTDQQVASRSFDDSTRLARNTPTIFDAVYQRSFFFDGRSTNLEDQALSVIHNQQEMGATLNDAATKLQTSADYVKLFAAAFPGRGADNITGYKIQKALVEYEKTLVTLNSRFDEYVSGNKASLSKEEINGFNLFTGKALCGTCHFFPLFNGTVPPFFTESEFEVIGVPDREDLSQLDGDVGRQKVTGLPIHNRAFKTPSVRNLQLTAPYMHNGAFNTIEEVVNFYNAGGGAGLGFELSHQTLPFDSLGLNHTEIKSIVAFMQSLAGKQSTVIPTVLPVVPNYGSRIIGGVY